VLQTHNWYTGRYVPPTAIEIGPYRNDWPQMSQRSRVVGAGIRSCRVMTSGGGEGPSHLCTPYIAHIPASMPRLADPMHRSGRSSGSRPLKAAIRAVSGSKRLSAPCWRLQNPGASADQSAGPKTITSPTGSGCRWIWPGLMAIASTSRSDALPARAAP